jgi:arylformamidase
VATRYEEIAGADHFTVLDPLTDPDSAMVARLLALVPQP